MITGFSQRFGDVSAPETKFLSGRFRLAVFGAALAWICLGVVVAADASNLANAPKPSPEPDAPTGWDYFRAPAITVGTAATIPAIAEYTRTGGPDDSLVLTGENFASASADQVYFVAYGQTTANNPTQVTAITRRLDGEKAIITLPTTLPSWSTYFLWPKNSVGYGQPVAVNRTETWWLNPAVSVTRGQTVSLYGRNLSHDGGTTSSWVYIKSPNAAGQWAAVTAVNPYRVQFTVPASLANGTYEVWSHNGHGGTYGWSGPLTLAVTDAYSWNGDTFNVRMAGAKGDGIADDTDAVATAYTAAMAYRDRTGLPPTLYFPAGTYLLRYGIGLEHDFRFLGDGKDRTFLQCNAAFAQPGKAGDGLKLGLIFGNGNSQHDIEIKGLTLDANGNLNPKVNSDSVLYCAWDRSTNVRLEDVRIQTLVAGTGCAFLNNIDRLVLTNCQFVGGRVFLFNGNQHAVTGCSFYGANDSDTAICLRGTSNVSVTGCYAADYKGDSSTGQGLGRFIAGNGDYGTQVNIYIGDNTTVNCGPRTGATDQNSGEQIMCEGNWTQYEATPTSATGTTITFSNLAKNYVGQVAVINRGKGLGQYRLITGFDANSKTITVSPAWNVAPDTSSGVLISYSAIRWVVYRNSLDGKDDYAGRYSAMVGIEPYGGCHDWIADSNTITNMYAGFCCVALEQTSPVTSIGPCFFHLYANNTIRACYEGIDNRCGIPDRTNDVGLGFLGNVFRKNRVTDIALVGVREWTGTPSTPGTPYDMNLFEHNSFENLATGFDGDFGKVSARAKNTILYDNTFDRGTAKLVGSVGANFGASANWANMVANAWRNFETPFSGALSVSTRLAPPRLQTAVYIP